MGKYIKEEVKRKVGNRASLYDGKTPLRSESTHSSRPTKIVEPTRKQDIVDEVLRQFSKRINYFGGGTASGPYVPVNDVNGSSLVGFIQSGAGAVARTVQAKEREIEVSVQDYGGVADGSFIAGGSVSGTNNLAAFQAADTALVARGGGVIKAPAGQYRLSGKFTPSRGVILRGEGNVHLPVYLSGTVRGTVLLVAGSAGDDCVAFAENTGHGSIEEISIFNTNTNTIRAVVNCTGVLYPRMKNVELGSLRKCAGSTSVGLLLARSGTSPNFETLYGTFENVNCTVTDQGLATEASLSIGLKIQGTSSTGKPTTNKFIGGDFQGRIKSLVIDGDAAGAGPVANKFIGTAFDATYNTDMEHAYVANGVKVVGYGTVEHVYVVKYVVLVRAHSAVFYGCYFEIAGVPATFDDSVNGVEPLLGVVALNDPTEVTNTDIIGCSWVGYLYDNGARTHCDPTASGYKYSARQIPKLTVRKNALQTVGSGALTDVVFGSVLEGDDAQLDFATPTATIKEAGTYVISWKITFVGWATAGTYGFTRLITTPASFDGGHFHNQGAAVPISSEGCATVTLTVSDTVKLQVLHVEGNNQDTTADAADNFMCLAKL